MRVLVLVIIKQYIAFLHSLNKCFMVVALVLRGGFLRHIFKQFLHF
jgi:hypothetical protein